MATVIAPVPFRLAAALPPHDADPDPAPAPARRATPASLNATRRRIEAETVARLADLSDCRVIAAAGEDAGLVLATVLARHGHATGLLRAADSGIGAAAPFPGVAARIRTRPPAAPVDGPLPRGADVYLVKRALAALDDAAALDWLADCRRFLPRHARLVLIENLVSRESFAAAWFASGAQARAGRSVDTLVHLVARAGLRAAAFTPHPAVDLLEAAHA